MSDSPQNKNLPDEPNSWQPCQAGAIQSVVSQQVACRRQRKMVIGSSATVLVLVVATTCMISFGPLGGPQAPEAIGKITCGEVKAKLKDYIAESLDEDVASRIKKHLDECPNCAEQYRKRKQAQSNSVGMYRHVAPCPCQDCRSNHLIAFSIAGH